MEINFFYVFFLLQIELHLPKTIPSHQYPNLQDIRTVSNTCRLIAPKLSSQSEANIASLAFLRSIQEPEREKEKRRSQLKGAQESGRIIDLRTPQNSFLLL